MHTPPQSPTLAVRRLGRRRFLQVTSLAPFLVVSARTLGLGAERAAGDRLNLACIGVNGRGRDDLEGVKGENIVALCDVDESRAVEARQKFPQARFFRDYRRLFDAVGNELDGVVIATPDHTHAGIAARAIRAGKHVYCEKPLAHSLWEVRRLMELAREHHVRTQLGNQGHSFPSIREFRELVESGVIGTVREVHARCESVYRPRFRTRPPEQPPVPATLDWDLWLGPAPYRPYHPAYHPGSWRRWVPFGTGVIGDWTCHVLDPVFWTLDLGAPASVQAEPLEYTDPAVRAETFPPGTVLRYEFPANGDRPAVKVTWFDGGCPPPAHAELETRKFPATGALIIGDRGKIIHGSHGAGGVQLLPAARNREFPQPARKYPRSPGHYEEWLLACKGGAPAGSTFDYGGPLTEIALLGNLAMRFPGQRLEWDATRLRVTNHAAADAWVRPAPRAGWEI